MAGGSAAFAFTSEELEKRTSLNRLEARGTVRLALKGAGLDAEAVSPAQMIAVVTRVLHEELTSRGVGDPADVCAAIADGLAHVQDGGSARKSADEIFARLGG